MTNEDQTEGQEQETEEERSAEGDGEGGTLGTAAKGAAAGAAAGAAIGAAATAGRDLLKSRGEATNASPTPLTSLTAIGNLVNQTSAAYGSPLPDLAIVCTRAITTGSSRRVPSTSASRSPTRMSMSRPRSRRRSAPARIKTS